MIILRNNVFETNSSSTHTLSIGNKREDYLPKNKRMVIRFINTDEERTLTTLKDKVSYLVSQIINRYKYNYNEYEELKERVEDSYDYQRIKDYVYDRFGITIELPKNHKVTRYKDEYGNTYTNLDEIVEINHQISYGDLDELLRDLVIENREYLDDVLDENSYIVFGRD